jgi:hypothetical protein
VNISHGNLFVQIIPEKFGVLFVEIFNEDCDNLQAHSVEITVHCCGSMVELGVVDYQ